MTPASDSPRYTMVVNPDSVRWSHYSRELQSFWESRGRTPHVNLIDWRVAIERGGEVRDLLDDSPSVLRIGSPARGFDLVRGFLRAGQSSLGEEPAEWEPPRPGWLAKPGLVYRGLCHVLKGLSESLTGVGAGHRPWHADAGQRCDDIATMFDKNRTSEVLETAGLPCPEWFRPPPSRYDLLAALEDRRWTTSYLKLAYGSCASGIVHLTFRDGGFRGITTVTEIEGHFHNTRRVQTLEGKALNSLLDFLLSEGATVQREIPKARVDGENFDVRVVVIRGSVAGAIFRSSPYPMTNLHLGGARADPQRCRNELSTRHWLDALDDSCAAAELFLLPSIGVDLAFDRHTGRPYIIELNAFGDFFPNWVNDDGRTIHQIEIESTAQAHQLC